MDISLRTFTFTKDSYWDSRGCSCCEPTLMEAYNSEDTDPNLGTAHDEPECYMQALLTTLADIGDADRDALYGMTHEGLLLLCTKLNIEVVING